MNYHTYNSAILRSPLLALKTEFSVDDLVELYSRKIVKEALYLASPILFDELQKNLNNGKVYANKKLQYSLLKYALRMHSRCTPFGLFSGCGVIEPNVNQSFIVEKHFTQSRLDMQFICSLVAHLLSIEGVIDVVKIYPNTSLYKLGDRFRFIEYKILNNRKKYFLSAVDKDPLLSGIIEYSKSGVYINELINNVLTRNSDIENDDLREFILTLIQEQVLVTELEPSLTSGDALKEIVSILSRQNFSGGQSKQLIGTLKKIDSILSDSGESSLLETFESINTEIASLNVAYDIGKLFQVDLFKDYKPTAKNLNLHQFENDLNFRKALIAINKLCPKEKNTELEDFKTSFIARYESQEVPLSLIFDTESGIGFGKSLKRMAVLANAEERQSPKKSTLIWNQLHSFLFKKITESMVLNNTTITITEKELSTFEERWDDLPVSIAVSYKHVGRIEELDVLQFKSAFGSSAINMLGRFACVNEEISNVAHSIENIEREYFGEDTIVAEIVHLPESRTGNVLQRPAFREYEIPYLSKSSLPIEKQIQLDDLYLSVRDNKLHLRSKRLNKRIIPRLSNAHNFKYGDLPVYHFLCELQSSEHRNGLFFSWGDLQKMFNFFPRIQLSKHVILCPAMWKLSKEDFKTLLEPSEKDQFNSKILTWRKTFNIPKLILLVEGDNELLINLEDALSVEMFISTIKAYQEVILAEFIFDSDTALLTEKGAQYTNEVIKIVYKTPESRIASEISEVTGLSKGNIQVKRNFAIGSEWVYYKIYCGVETAERFLTERLPILLDEITQLGLISKWFFVNYQDPSMHVRIRLELRSSDCLGELLRCFNHAISSFLNDGLIWKVQTDTYVRELERYGAEQIQFVESIFFADSQLISNFYAIVNESENAKISLAVLIIEEILNGLKLDLQEKSNLLDFLKRAFHEEFAVTKTMKLSIDSKYRDVKPIIFDALAHCGENYEVFKPKLEDYNYQSTKAYQNILEIYFSGRNTVSINSLASSLIHMTMNRLFSQHQRQNELYLYDFLARAYKTNLILKRNDK